MTHTFLTGPIQIGKSTAIRRYLKSRPDLRVGGFRTVWKEPRDAAVNSVHIVPAMGSVPLTAENRVMVRRFAPERQVESYPAVFDTLGTALLATEGYDLILMDEIGAAEDEARIFGETVLHLLDGEIPVLGVVQFRPGVLTDAIRRHPRVRLLTVSEENRGDIPALLDV